GMLSTALVIFGLTACAADDPPAQQPTATGPDATAGLGTASTPLGTIVVDAAGMTVYQFDDDTQGGDASACTGACAATWPAVAGDAGDVEIDGITGEVGTITGIAGEPQLTLNGWPLYTYAGDSEPGDVSGQGVNGIWWVLSPAGERITENGGPGGMSY